MASPSAKTPESYFAGLRRKDSKNALTTCHGVTDKGKACRRALKSPKNSSKFDGAVVITTNVEDPAVFFCWQHKDQADSLDADEGSVVQLKGRHSLEDAFRNLGLEDVDEEPSPTGEAPNHDGLLQEPTRTVAKDHGEPSLRTEYQSHRESPSYGRARQKNQERISDSAPRPKPRRKSTTEQHQRRNHGGLFSSLIMCCFSDEPLRSESRSRNRRGKVHKAEGPKPIEVYTPPSEMRGPSGPAVSGERPLRRPSMEYKPLNQQLDGARLRQPGSSQPGTPSPPLVSRREVPSRRKGSSRVETRHHSGSSSRRASEGHQDNHLDVPAATRPRLQIYRDSGPGTTSSQPYLRPPLAQSDPRSNQRPSNLRSVSTPDPQQLGRIHGDWPPALPRNTSDATRICYAKLLTAMSEPPSKTDSPGYIYIFWQTDVEQTDDETSAVASIMTSPTNRGLQRQETVLQRRFFQTSANARIPQTGKRTVFLKIGRAVNVHQRLNQWKKQCEYDISLLRSYPYDSKKASTGPVPNVAKVERLIHLHLEMLGQRVKKECRCGTEHKEWFEAEATAKAVRDVDEVVRNWVKWSEDKFGS